MKRDFESTILLIYNHMSLKYPNVLVKEESKFIGYKFEPSQYFILFISIHEGIMKLTYREDFTNMDVIRVNIENYSDQDLLSLIDNIMLKAYSIKEITNLSEEKSNRRLSETETIDLTSFYNTMNIIDAKSLSLNKEYIEKKYSKITLELLPLSVRAYNCLKRGGYNALSDIINTPLCILSKVHFLGRKCTKELIDIKIKVLIDEGVLNSSVIDPKYLVNYQDFNNINCYTLNISKKLKNLCYENNIETLGELINLEGNFDSDLKNEINELKSAYGLTMEDFVNKYVVSSIHPLSDEPIDIEALSNISESQYEKYIDFGVKVGEIINEYLSKMKNQRNADILRYRFNIIDNDNETLQAISNIVGLSRERVRQIIEKELRRMRFRGFKRNYLSKIINLINDVEGIEIFNYYICGIMNVYNKTFLKYLLDLMDSNYSRRVFDRITELENMLLIKQKKDPLISKANSIINSIIFPNSTKDNKRFFYNLATMRRVNEYNNIGTVYLDSINKNIKYESFSEKRVLEFLDKYEDIEDIKAQSIALSYYYEGKQHKYYPDFQILFKDGRMAIIEVKDLFNMGDYTVKEKYHTLVNYCEQNGMGYLMIDERMNDYESIKNNHYDNKKDKMFTDYLSNHNPMNYADLQEFNKIASIDTKSLISIFINNDMIKMNRTPFRISLNK